VIYTTDQLYVSHFKFIRVFNRDNRCSPTDRQVVCGLTVEKFA